MRIAIVSLLFALFATTVISLPVSQHNKRRPVPTDKLPIPALSEDPDTDYDPKPSDINDAQLIERLGVDYLPDFMSPAKPNNNHTEHQYNQHTRVSPEVRKLSKVLVRTLKNRKKNKKTKRLIRKIQSQITQAVTCSVMYRWKDLGIRFWPRYVKEGRCDTSKSCSIPTGMHCKSAGHMSIKILRWYCQGILEQKYCLWIDVKYPITSQCKCQC